MQNISAIHLQPKLATLMSDKCKPQNTGIQNYSHSDNAQFDGMCKDNWAPLWCLNRPVIFSGYTKFITDCSKCWAFLQVTILSLHVIVCKISDVSFYQYAIFYYACCTLSFKKKNNKKSFYAI